MQEDPLTALLGQPLRELREAAELTQAQLAARIGVSATAIGQFERSAKQPRLRTALRLLAELCTASSR